MVSLHGSQKEVWLARSMERGRRQGAAGTHMHGNRPPERTQSKAAGRQSCKGWGRGRRPRAGPGEHPTVGEHGGGARGRAAKKEGEGKQERSRTQRVRGRCGAGKPAQRLRRYPEKRKCRQINTRTLVSHTTRNMFEGGIWEKTFDICGQSGVAHRGERRPLMREQPGASRAQLARQGALGFLQDWGKPRSFL